MEALIWKCITELVVFGGLFGLIFLASIYLDRYTDLSKKKKRSVHIRY